MDINGEIIEIKGSPAKLFGLLIAGFVMIGACLFILFGMLPDDAGLLGLPIQIIAWFGILFFGFCTLIAISRILTLSKTVITFLPEGLLDVRVAQRPIPWIDMEEISVWSSNGQNIIVIAVAPDVEQQLGLSLIARKTRNANRKLGADGLCIASTGLKISHDDLLRKILERADAARPREVLS